MHGVRILKSEKIALCRFFRLIGRNDVAFEVWNTGKAVSFGAKLCLVAWAEEWVDAFALL